MIVLAAVYIVFESIRRLIAGPKPEDLGAGALLVLAAGLINGALGGYLVEARGRVFESPRAYHATAITGFTHQARSTAFSSGL